MATLESQIDQITIYVGEGEEGTFPSQTDPNPKEQFAVGNLLIPMH